MVINDDGSRNREVETRYETPLWYLDNEFGVVEEFTWNTPNLGAEKKARSRRVGGFEEIGRGLIELDSHKIPIAGTNVVSKGLDLGGELNDFGEELRGSRRFGVPLTIAEEDDLLCGCRMGRSNQGADIVLLGNLPRRDREGPQSSTVLRKPSRPAFGASLSQVFIP